MLCRLITFLPRIQPRRPKFLSTCTPRFDRIRSRGLLSAGPGSASGSCSCSQNRDRVDNITGRKDGSLNLNAFGFSIRSSGYFHNHSEIYNSCHSSFSKKPTSSHQSLDLARNRFRIQVSASKQSKTKRAKGQGAGIGIAVSRPLDFVSTSFRQVGKISFLHYINMSLVFFASLPSVFFNH